jgi:hypothetical protein
MTELVVTLWALGGIGTAMALYSMVETSHEEMTASKNAIMVRDYGYFSPLACSCSSLPHHGPSS